MNSFPRILRPLWRRTDPASRCRRRCDALGRESVHQRLTTTGGDYWVCGETGQLERDRTGFDLAAHHAVGRGRGGSADPSVAAVRRLALLHARYRQTGRLFEVGVGEGGRLRAAVQAGWRAEGQESVPELAGRARENSGAEVRVGPIESIELEEAVYDVVLLNHAFERLVEPRRVMAKLARSLRVGGVIFLQTLNAQSLSLAVRPQDWVYFAPGHLVIPTLVSLRHYLEANRLLLRQLSTHGFRSVTAEDREQGRGRRRRDRWGALVAARMRLGHRVKCLAQRAGEDH